MNLRVLAIGVVVLGLVAWLGLRGCGDEEKERVAASLAAMVAAVEAGDRETLSEYISLDYSDRFGHDQAAAVRRVMDEVEHYDAVAIELKHLDIDIEKKTGFATARFLPEFVGDMDAAKKTRPKYSFQSGQRLRLRLRKDGTRYQVVRADMGVSLSGALK